MSARRWWRSGQSQGQRLPRGLPTCQVWPWPQQTQGQAQVAEPPSRPSTLPMPRGASRPGPRKRGLSGPKRRTLGCTLRSSWISPGPDHHVAREIVDSRLQREQSFPSSFSPALLFSQHFSRTRKTEPARTKSTVPPQQRPDLPLVSQPCAWCVFCQHFSGTRKDQACKNQGSVFNIITTALKTVTVTQNEREKRRTSLGKL
ncbi:uncharacterized protein LOC113879511 isoform X2 [Bos indicus x Bos taurus]|uniref:uncharacterized protein LOC113879511 isoform X2 n=1 Tax=Bos indicus x Bos taurus TaxID=30522 RepID=UPI000F7D39F7|nr:uncharacterized protein LOC113879511 isoform X2 [Bos indicus x Bos taurus]